MDHDFEPGFHDDECTHSDDGTWATYCGRPRREHLDGFPEPDADGRYDYQKVMDFVVTRNMERAEAIAEAWGTHAVLRFPWD